MENLRGRERAKLALPSNGTVAATLLRKPHSWCLYLSLWFIWFFFFIIFISSPFFCFSPIFSILFLALKWILKFHFFFGLNSSEFWNLNLMHTKLGTKMGSKSKHKKSLTPHTQELEATQDPYTDLKTPQLQFQIRQYSIKPGWIDNRQPPLMYLCSKTPFL